MCHVNGRSCCGWESKSTLPTLATYLSIALVDSGKPLADGDRPGPTSKPSSNSHRGAAQGLPLSAPRLICHPFLHGYHWKIPTAERAFDALNLSSKFILPYYCPPFFSVLRRRRSALSGSLPVLALKQ